MGTSIQYPSVSTLYDIIGVVNVRDFGARGDTRIVEDGVLVNGTGLLSSATAKFTPADQGKTIYAVENVSGGLVCVPTGIIVEVVSTTQVRSNRIGTTPYPGGLIIVWGHLDGAAIHRAMDYCTEQFAATGVQSSLYLPAGGYLSELAPIINVPIGCAGMTIAGSSMGGTRLYLTPDVALASGSQGQYISAPSASYLCIRDMWVEGAHISFPSAPNNTWAVFFNGCGQLLVERLLVNRHIASGAQSNYGFFANSCTSITLRNVVVAASTTGMALNAVSGLSAYDSGGTNCANENLIISSLGDEKTGAGAKFFGGIFDENGTATGATSVVNCGCVVFTGITMFGPPSGIALRIANSTVRMVGCFAGPFNTDTDTSGVCIADAISTLYLTNSHLTHSGTGVALDNTHGGTYVDGGANLID